MPGMRDTTRGPRRVAPRSALRVRAVANEQVLCLRALPAWRRGCGCWWMEPLSLYRSTAPVLPACWKEVASASATSPKTSRAPWELWPLMSVHTRL